MTALSIRDGNSLVGQSQMGRGQAKELKITFSKSANVNDEKAKLEGEMGNV